MPGVELRKKPIARRVWTKSMLRSGVDVELDSFESRIFKPTVRLLGTARSWWFHRDLDLGNCPPARTFMRRHYLRAPTQRRPCRREMAGGTLPAIGAGRRPLAWPSHPQIF